MTSAWKSAAPSFIRMGSACELRGVLTQEGLAKKSDFSWLEFRQSATSSGKVLHGPNKHLHAHFSDRFMCVNVETEPDLKTKTNKIQTLSNTTYD